MKRIVIGTRNDALLTTLELLLRHWGYRVLATANQEHLQQSLEKFTPNLLLIDSELLADPGKPLYGAVAARIVNEHLPLVILASEEAAAVEIPHQRLRVPLDIFELFTIIQQLLQKIPRHNLRMTVKLPALLARNGSSQFADILSLSSQGLFVKTSLPVKVNDVLHIVLPLLGMKQEIEIGCQVIYCVAPAAGNNYLQGFGLKFVDSDPGNIRALQQFLENRLLEEVTRLNQGLDNPTEALYNRSEPIKLRLPNPA